jgi:hypothetical protein
MWRFGLAAMAVFFGSPPVIAQQLGINAPWGGWSRPGASSELDIEIPAIDEPGGNLRIVARGEEGSVTANVMLSRSTPTRVRLAVPAQGGLDIEAITDNGLTLRARQDFKSAERPVLAWVDSGLRASAAPPAPAGLRIEALQPADLPRLAASYSSMAGLVITGSALAELDDAQLLALLEQLRRCGFVFLASETSQAQAVLQRAAGCGGRNLVLAASLPDAGQLTQAFAAQWIAPALAGNRISSLGAGDRRVAVLAAVLLAYAIVALLLLTSTARLRWLLGLPLLAAGAIQLALFAMPFESSLIVWAEAGGRDANAQYTALLQVRSAAPGLRSVDLPPALGNAGFGPPGDGNSLRWDPVAARLLGAQVHSRMLAESALQFNGSFPTTGAATITAGADNRLILRNARTATLSKAWLLYRGRQYAIADVAPLGQVTIDIGAGQQPGDRAQRLAAERLAYDEAGILLALDLSGTRGRDSPHIDSGWLLIRQPLAQVSL